MSTPVGSLSSRLLINYASTMDRHYDQRGDRERDEFGRNRHYRRHERRSSREHEEERRDRDENYRRDRYKDDRYRDGDDQRGRQHERYRNEHHGRQGREDKDPYRDEDDQRGGYQKERHYQDNRDNGEDRFYDDDGVHDHQREQENFPDFENPQSLEAGIIVRGSVARIEPYGAFVDFNIGRDFHRGLAHISQLAEGRVERVESVVQMNQPVFATVVEVQEQGRQRPRIRLSLKDVDQITGRSMMPRLWDQAMRRAIQSSFVAPRIANACFDVKHAIGKIRSPRCLMSDSCGLAVPVHHLRRHQQKKNRRLIPKVLPLHQKPAALLPLLRCHPRRVGVVERGEEAAPEKRGVVGVAKNGIGGGAVPPVVKAAVKETAAVPRHCHPLLDHLMRNVHERKVSTTPTYLRVLVHLSLFRPWTRMS